MKGTDKVLDGLKVTHLCFLLQYRCSGKVLTLVEGMKFSRNVKFIYFVCDAFNFFLISATWNHLCVLFPKWVMGMVGKFTIRFSEYK
jgi:hypothetical protein